MWILCEAKYIRLTPMYANEPKDAESKPFKAGSGLIALANLKNVKNGRHKLCLPKFYFVPRRERLV